jgi:cell division protein FtsB
MNFPLFKYRYWIFFGFFFLWMMFFDSNNFIYRLRLASEISDLEESIEIHKVKIDELRRQKKDLFGNQRNLEKFAREKYLMKKSNEDIFVIVDAEVNSDEKMIKCGHS